MDCIPYINDLTIEINVLKQLEEKVLDPKNKKIIHKQIQEKQILIDKCKDNLSKLSPNSVEYRLYLKILNGLNPSRAVKEIADENYQMNIKPTTPSKIWEKYYKKIKKFI